MAELLVRTQNNAHRHPDKDRATYKRGDVVVVMPDGHQWGRMESLKVWTDEGLPANAWNGGFTILEVPGAPVSDFAHLLEEQFPDQPTKYIRRNQSLDLTSLVDKLPITEKARAGQLGKARVEVADIVRETTTKPVVTLTQRALNKLVKQ
jgi:hypothetical protein